MAKDFSVTGEARLDTRKAEADLSKFVKKAESININLKGIDSKKFTQPLGKITGSVSEFSKSLDASNARVIAFTASAGILFTVVKAFKEMAVATIEVEKTLKDINVIMGASTSKLQQFSGALMEVAKNTGQSFYQVGEAATEFARQGLSMEKTLTRTRDALILMRLSGMDATAAVNSLTAAINSFNQTALTSTEIINKMANVDAAFAVSTNDLAEAIRRVGSTAEDVNVSFDELLATVTSVQQTTARGGNIIGNSLKTIFTRIQRTQVIDQLKSLGIQVRTNTGEMRPAMKVLAEFAKVYDKLHPSLKASTAELVGGVYQMNILKALLKDLKKDYSIYNGALRTSIDSTNEAIGRNAELNKTMKAMLNEAIQNLTQFGSAVGKLTFEPVFKKIINGFNSLSKEVTFFGDIGSLFGIDEKDANEFGGRMARGVMKSIGRFLEGPGLVALVAVAGKLFIDFTRFLGSSVKDMMGLNRAATQQAQIQQQISDILSKEPELVKRIETGETSRLNVERKIIEALQAEIRQREQILKLSKQMATSVGAHIGTRTSKSTGTTTLINRSQGHIPSLAPSANEFTEMIGAMQAGYKPGDVKQMSIPNLGRVTYNSAETVKKFDGIEQPAIIPPGKAGVKYAKNFENVWGFDPRNSASYGFVPNFLSVLTSMRLGVHRQGKQGTSGTLKITGAELAHNLGPELAAVVGHVIPPGEMVTIHTMGQQSPITKKESEGFARGKGRLAAQKGQQQEAAFARRPGGFSLNSLRGRAQVARRMDESKLKLPYDSGEHAGKGVDRRLFPVESKPSFRKRYVAQIFKKTLYENNSSTLRHIKRRLQAKMDGGDMVAAKHMETLQKRIGIETQNRDNEISQWTMGGKGPAIGSLSELNNRMGFDTRNAIAGRRENLFHEGFVPNFIGAPKLIKGGRGRSGPMVWDATRSAAMLIPEGGISSKGGKFSEQTLPGSGGSQRYRFNIHDPDIQKDRKKTLHQEVTDALTRIAIKYAKSITPPLNAKPNPRPYFNTGAMKAATGNVFEAAIDSAFKRSPDVETATWDVRAGSRSAPAVRKLFGVNAAMHADYKVSDSPKNQGSFTKKIYHQFGAQMEKAAARKAGTKKGGTQIQRAGQVFDGFIPNFQVIPNWDDDEYYWRRVRTSHTRPGWPQQRREDERVNFPGTWPYTKKFGEFDKGDLGKGAAEKEMWRSLMMGMPMRDDPDLKKMFEEKDWAGILKKTSDTPENYIQKWVLPGLARVGGGGRAQQWRERNKKIDLFPNHPARTIIESQAHGTGVPVGPNMFKEKGKPFQKKGKVASIKFNNGDIMPKATIIGETKESLTVRSKETAGKPVTISKALIAGVARFKDGADLRSSFSSEANTAKLYKQYLTRAAKIKEDFAFFAKDMAPMVADAKNPFAKKMFQEYVDKNPKGKAYTRKEWEEMQLHDAGILLKDYRREAIEGIPGLFKAKGKAKGFVPNFASSLSKAFKTEAALGGRPVLDYHPSVGPMVRDDRTQKTASQALSDHRKEGIGVAIQNSKALQGMFANSGFVPNFAESASEPAMTGFDSAAITASMAMAAFGFMQMKDAAASVTQAFMALNETANSLNSKQSQLEDELASEVDAGGTYEGTRAQRLDEIDTEIGSLSRADTSEETEFMAKLEAGGTGHPKMALAQEGKDLGLIRKGRDELAEEANAMIKGETGKEYAPRAQTPEGKAIRARRKQILKRLEDENNQKTKDLKTLKADTKAREDHVKALQAEKRTIKKAQKGHEAAEEVLRDKVTVNKKLVKSMEKEAAEYNVNQSTSSSKMIRDAKGKVIGGVGKDAKPGEEFTGFLQGKAGKGSAFMNRMGGMAMGGMMLMPAISGAATAAFGEGRRAQGMISGAETAGQGVLGAGMLYAMSDKAAGIAKKKAVVARALEIKRLREIKTLGAASAGTRAAVAAGGAGATGMAGAAAAIPYVAIAIAIAAVFYGIFKAMDGFINPMEDLIATAEKAKEKLTEFSNTSQSYLSNMEQWTSAMQDPMVDTKELIKRRDAMDESFRDLPMHIREQFGAVKGDAKAIAKYFEDARKHLQDDSRQADAGVKFQEGYEDERGWLVDFSRDIMGVLGMQGRAKNVDDRSPFFQRLGWVQEGDEMFEESNAGRKRRTDFSQMMQREVSDERLKSTSGKRAIGRLSALQAGNINSELSTDELEEFVSIMRELRMPEEYIENMRRAAENTHDGAKALKDFEKNLKMTQEKLEKTIKLEKERVKQREALLKHQERMAKLTKRIKVLNATLATTTQMELARIKALNSLKFGREDFRADLAKTFADLGIKLAEPFIGLIEKSQLDYATKIASVNIKENRSMRKVISDSVDAGFAIVNGQFLASAQKVQQLSTKIEGGTSGTQIIDLKQQTAMMSATAPIVQDLLKRMRIAPRSFAFTAQDIAKLEGAIKKAGGENAKEAAEGVRMSIQQLQDKLTDNLGIIADESRRQRIILYEQQKLQEKILQQRERLRSVGGTGGYLEGGTFGLSRNIGKLTKSFDSMKEGFVTFSRKAGLPGVYTEEKAGGIRQGRAAFSVLDNLVNNLNLRAPEGKRMGASAFGGLLGASVQGRTQDIKGQIAYAKSITQVLGGDLTDEMAASFDLAEEGAEDTALEQIAAQLKVSDIAPNVESINQNIKILNHIVESQGRTMYDNNRKAFQDALIHVGLTGQANMEIGNKVAKANVYAIGGLAGGQSIAQVVGTNQQGFIMINETLTHLARLNEIKAATAMIEDPTSGLNQEITNYKNSDKNLQDAEQRLTALMALGPSAYIGALPVNNTGADKRMRAAGQPIISRASGGTGPASLGKRRGRLIQRNISGLDDYLKEAAGDTDVMRDDNRNPLVRGVWTQPPGAIGHGAAGGSAGGSGSILRRRQALSTINPGLLPMNQPSSLLLGPAWQRTAYGLSTAAPGMDPTSATGLPNAPWLGDGSVSQRRGTVLNWATRGSSLGAGTNFDDWDAIDVPGRGNDETKLLGDITKMGATALIDESRGHQFSGGKDAMDQDARGQRGLFAYIQRGFAEVGNWRYMMSQANDDETDNEYGDKIRKRELTIYTAMEKTMMEKYGLTAAMAKQYTNMIKLSQGSSGPTETTGSLGKMDDDDKTWHVGGDIFTGKNLAWQQSGYGYAKDDTGKGQSFATADKTSLWGKEKVRDDRMMLTLFQDFEDIRSKQIEELKEQIKAAKEGEKAQSDLVALEIRLKKLRVDDVAEQKKLNARLTRPFGASTGWAGIPGFGNQALTDWNAARSGGGPDLDANKFGDKIFEQNATARIESMYQDVLLDYMRGKEMRVDPHLMKGLTGVLGGQGKGALDIMQLQNRGAGLNVFTKTGRVDPDIVKANVDSMEKIQQAFTDIGVLTPGWDPYYQITKVQDDAFKKLGVDWRDLMDAKTGTFDIARFDTLKLAFTRLQDAFSHVDDFSKSIQDVESRIRLMKKLAQAEREGENIEDIRRRVIEYHVRQQREILASQVDRLKGERDLLKADPTTKKGLLEENQKQSIEARLRLMRADTGPAMGSLAQYLKLDPGSRQKFVDRQKGTMATQQKSVLNKITERYGEFDSAEDFKDAFGGPMMFDLTPKEARKQLGKKGTFDRDVYDIYQKMKKQEKSYTDTLKRMTNSFGNFTQLLADFVENQARLLDNKITNLEDKTFFEKRDKTMYETERTPAKLALHEANIRRFDSQWGENAALLGANSKQGEEWAQAFEKLSGLWRLYASERVEELGAQLKLLDREIAALKNNPTLTTPESRSGLREKETKKAEEDLRLLFTYQPARDRSKKPIMAPRSKWSLKRLLFGETHYDTGKTEDVPKAPAGWGPDRKKDGWKPLFDWRKRDKEKFTDEQGTGDWQGVLRSKVGGFGLPSLDSAASVADQIKDTLSMLSATTGTAINGLRDNLQGQQMGLLKNLALTAAGYDDMEGTINLLTAITDERLKWFHGEWGRMLGEIKSGEAGYTEQQGILAEINIANSMMFRKRMRDVNEEVQRARQDASLYEHERVEIEKKGTEVLLRNFHRKMGETATMTQDLLDQVFKNAQRGVGANLLKQAREIKLLRAGGTVAGEREADAQTEEYFRNQLDALQGPKGKPIMGDSQQVWNEPEKGLKGKFKNLWQTFMYNRDVASGMDPKELDKKYKDLYSRRPGAEMGMGFGKMFGGTFGRQDKWAEQRPKHLLPSGEGWKARGIEKLLYGPGGKSREGMRSTTIATAAAELEYAKMLGEDPAVILEKAETLLKLRGDQFRRKYGDVFNEHLDNVEAGNEKEKYLEDLRNIQSMRAVERMRSAQEALMQIQQDLGATGPEVGAARGNLVAEGIRAKRENRRRREAAKRGGIPFEPMRGPGTPEMEDLHRWDPRRILGQTQRQKIGPDGKPVMIPGKPIEEYQFGDTLKQIKDNWEYDNEAMATDGHEALVHLSESFRSETAKAFASAIKGAESLEKAFQKMFESLADYALQKVLDMAMKRFVFNTVAGMFGAKGGLATDSGFQHYARGGMVEGGSGTVDDVPALLKRGEYVVRQGAVKKYGTSYFDLLNNDQYKPRRKVMGYAGGGPVAGSGTAMTGGHNFGRHNPTTGLITYSDGSTMRVQDMEALRRQRGLPTYTHTVPEDERGFWESRTYKVDYWKHLAESKERGGMSMDPRDIAKMKRKWEENAFADPQEGLYSSITHSDNYADLALRNAFVYDSDKFPTIAKSYYDIDSRLSRQALLDDSNPRNKIRKQKVDKLYGHYKTRQDELKQWKEDVAEHRKRKAKRLRNTMYMIAGMWALNTVMGGESMWGGGGDTFGQKFQKGLGRGAARGKKFFGFGGGDAAGGLVGMAAGGAIANTPRDPDNVPAMLMDGEYVMNRDSVDRYGISYFSRLNKGLIDNLPHFAEGGYVTGGRSNSGTTTTGGDLFGSSGGDIQNNITINVNISQDGAASSNVIVGGGRQGEMSFDEAHGLSEMIKSKVVETIIQQRRQGGLLHRTAIQ